LTLLEDVKASPLFTFQTGYIMTKVLKLEGKVNSIKHVCKDREKKELRGPVIFATRGFAGNANGLLATYCPDLAGFLSTNAPTLVLNLYSPR
jgi:FAD-dependent fumarate reductase